MCIRDRVLQEDARYKLCWITRKSSQPRPVAADSDVPIVALADADWGPWLDAHPVDALVDFSRAESLHAYGEQIRQRRITLISAISAYSPQDLDYGRSLGGDTRVEVDKKQRHSGQKARHTQRD